MNNRSTYDAVCIAASRKTTGAFSTSFSLGIRLLHKRFRDPVHAIYGFVRFADEIVDTFHGPVQHELFDRFRADTEHALKHRISLNPILHSFQKAAHRFGIEREPIDLFLDSMATDLYRTTHDRASYDRYILGSAEAVGLMCLRVFAEGDDALFERLKEQAMSLGAAFQKVNFLRDLRQDNVELGRSYFPGIDLRTMTAEQKTAIEADIEADLEHALEGIRQLPHGARSGVHVAYLFQRALFAKIRSTPPHELFTRRIRVHGVRKARLVLGTVVQYRLNLLS